MKQLRLFFLQFFSLVHYTPFNPPHAFSFPSSSRPYLLPSSPLSHLPSSPIFPSYSTLLPSSTLPFPSIPSPASFYIISSPFPSFFPLKLFPSPSHLSPSPSFFYNTFLLLIPLSFSSFLTFLLFSKCLPIHVNNPYPSLSLSLQIHA